MRKMFSKPIFALVLLLAGASAQFAQVSAPKSLAPNVREHKLDSKLMAREMSYRVVLPASYDSPTEKVSYPVIYLLHGLTGNFANWTDRTKVADYARKHNFLIVTPDGGNGWYTDSVTTATDKYESYIVKELVPEIERKFRVKSDRQNRLIAGLSMGGYGALKFGLKYPEMFFLAGSFSGAIGAAEFSERTAGAIGKSMDAIYGTEGSASRAANDVFKLVRELTPEGVKALPFIYVSCGNEDFLINNNRDFMRLLVEKRVPHEYRQHPGVHDWVFWDDQIREFMSVAERRMKK